MTPPKILVFAGSIRSGALSAKLAAVAAKEIALADAEVTQISLADYPLPLFNGDIETEKGVPENATKLARLLVAHQGAFIATPEYNHSLPPLLKNTLDWISRIKHTGTIPYRHKVYGMGATSDTRFGGARAIRASLARFKAAGRGVIVYLRDGTAGVPVAEIPHGDTGTDAARSRQWREIGLGAQILKDLGISSIRLLTSSKRTYVGLGGFGIEIVATEPIEG